MDLGENSCIPSPFPNQTDRTFGLANLLPTDAEAFFFIAGAPIWMSFYSIWLFEARFVSHFQQNQDGPCHAI